MYSISLDSYRHIFENYSKPSDNQIEDFVNFVSSAKSWYKHLPLMPPGVPFFFFFDQYAGWNRIKKFWGGIQYEKRSEKDTQLHYSYIPTDKYQERFGFLSFSCIKGTRTQNVTLKGIENSSQLDPVITTANEEAVGIPEEVVKVGCVYLTAWIHPATSLFCFRYLNEHQYKFIDVGEGHWPEESGGDKVLKEIIETVKLSECRIEENNQDLVMKKMIQLIYPEHIRLRNQMFKAIKDVSKLIYD